MGNLVMWLYVIATSMGLVAIKLGSSNSAPISLVDGRLAFNINLINGLGIVLYGISFLLYIYLISKNDLGYIIPLTTALVYSLVFLASFVVFHEAFTLTKLAGIILIFVGVALINIQS